MNFQTTKVLGKIEKKNIWKQSGRESLITFNSTGTVLGLPSPSAALANRESEAENERYKTYKNNFFMVGSWRNSAELSLTCSLNHGHHLGA